MNDAQRPVATTSGKIGAASSEFRDPTSASIPGAPGGSLPQPVSAARLPGALPPASPLFSPVSAVLLFHLIPARRWAQGKKTYATAAAVLFLLLGQWRGWWNLPPQLYLGLLALAQVFLRNALGRLKRDA